GKDVALGDKVSAELAQLKPFSDVSLGKKLHGKVTIDAINDWGGVQSYEIH
ncbi:TPA: fimbrial chaperone protein, partial [Escherichia coli]|nr:fimbrial chaperone protein [Escherichia coli]